MPCGKRALVKNWDKPREIRVIKPSRYEQNEASVKVHWRNAIRALELSYQDEAFWASQSDTVRELVGPKIYKRIVKIFDLPDEKHYQPRSERSSLDPSELYYQTGSGAPVAGPTPGTYSESDFDPAIYDDMGEEEEPAVEQSELWTTTSETTTDLRRPSKSRSMLKAKSLSSSKTISKSFSKSMSKSFSKLSKTKIKPISPSSRIMKSGLESSIDEPATTLDDLEVHVGEDKMKQAIRSRFQLKGRNPHFDMLYCNKSETDMIKWKSKYKQKTIEVSASDEFSKKAEIMTKKIAKEFYDWWSGLGNVEFKSEIKRPQDIEDLFQVWFDEHASRGLVLDPKILPCVLQSIADYVGAKKRSCPRVLKRQIAYDIHAETSPAHTMAFGTCLPQKLKHIPPKNNTESLWHCVKIPEDLRTMACVWDNIQHLTSTKTFHQWLQKRPHFPMPPFLKSLEEPGEKKQPFIVPSDYVLKEKTSLTSTPDLALPVSEFSLELKAILSELLND
ncbi:uncharacterized protein LOC123866025 [Maniola jurtina]|uniref:uncharacterized protein LOC123866025 n=1 Tax=Maniola jurtina TaxID=191418 RepID=UPI001E68B4F8|nr:uncharacterized protein LOC123866025 [Maniola jurtina]XP_045763285.1 uncharacterized protein LOC123866025 [Maniola jurtina]XP_045763286.1 uncharacterized protein LOC123866025 [Maniola jurtina]XP_045763287.1 uncharacterized protein LOC123866025 [Maniola jurtina]